ncbi:MAG: TerC family protein [Phycisphaerales bacterium]|nr:TerC family protein [Phycisphaerales bacterium]
MLAPDLLTLASDPSIAGAAPETVAFFSAAGLLALLTLTVLEVVLGIDNVVFIAILTDKLPEEKRPRIRSIGLLLAMVMRLILLGLAYWIVKLTEPWFHVFDRPFSGKSLLLLGGGLFLIFKAVLELHHLVATDEEHRNDPHTRPGMKKAGATVGQVLMQILLLDLVFSLDSVITAVGMTTNYYIMATAVIISIAVMLAFAGPIARFVSKHPSMKNLALAFLVLIGVLLVAEGIGEHFNRGYIYFAIVFAFLLELINMQTDKKAARKRRQAVAQKIAEDPNSPAE